MHDFVPVHGKFRWPVMLMHYSPVKRSLNWRIGFVVCVLRVGNCELFCTNVGYIYRGNKKPTFVQNVAG